MRIIGRQILGGKNKEGMASVAVEAESRENKVNRLATVWLDKLAATPVGFEDEVYPANNLKETMDKFGRVLKLPFYTAATIMVDHSQQLAPLAALRNFVLDHWEAQQRHDIERRSHLHAGLAMPTHFLEGLGRKAAEEAILMEGLHLAHDFIPGLDKIKILGRKNEAGELIFDTAGAGVGIFVLDKAARIFQDMTAVAMAKMVPEEMKIRITKVVDGELQFLDAASAKKNEKLSGVAKLRNSLSRRSLAA